MVLMLAMLEALRAMRAHPSWGMVLMLAMLLPVLVFVIVTQ